MWLLHHYTWYFLLCGAADPLKEYWERPKLQVLYVTGMMVKMFGAIAVCLVYVFYYGGGDTINYHIDCVAVSKLFLKHPWQAIRFTFLPIDAEMYYSFDNETGAIFLLWLRFQSHGRR